MNCALDGKLTLLDSDCQYNQKETDAVVLWGMLGEEIKETIRKQKCRHLLLPAIRYPNTEIAIF